MLAGESERPLTDVVAAARDGSTAALAELYQRYAALVLRLAYRLSGSRADAEDIAHDVFVGLPEALHRYEERGAFESWLKRVTARVALSRVRRRSARAEVRLADSNPDPATSDATDRLALARAIDELPEALRRVFVLHALEGYPHSEVAELLGISTTASQVRLSRALQRLRKRLRTE